MGWLCTCVYRNFPSLSGLHELCASASLRKLQKFSFFCMGRLHVSLSTETSEMFHYSMGKTVIVNLSISETSEIFLFLIGRLHVSLSTETSEMFHYSMGKTVLLSLLNGDTM
ncbi:hypothetical protein BaRGS_00017400 [Batillaria attramentaria]|uniref:Uncharacterized protein n=1 Tax=Batillaria attramentaria TaxID=370345 RepID=A0ABD0KVY8_9CAEN